MMLAFILLGALALAGGILTVAAKNAVHAALGLVMTLLCVAGLFASMSASFLAATQVIVYAGAIMVLFLFVIMLLAANKPVTTRDPLPFVGPFGAIAAFLLAGSFVTLALTYRDPQPLAQSVELLRNGTAGAVGETLLTRFLLPFEAVSILLLVAIVGSVALVQRPAVQPDGVTDEADLSAQPTERAWRGQRPAVLRSETVKERA